MSARAPTQVGAPGRRESETHAHACTHACTHARQIILELLELREVDVARAMLRQTECMLTMKQEQPERHMRLEALASRPIWCVRMCLRGACLLCERDTCIQTLSLVNGRDSREAYDAGATKA